MRVYSYKTKEASDKPARRKLWKLKKFKLRFKFGKFSWRKFLVWTFRLAACGILFAALLFLYYAHDLPNPDQLLARTVPESTKIMAKDGSLLYEVHGEYKRTRVGLDQISTDLKNATIAVEDKDFYKHGGISITGILRAVVKDITTGSLAEGGSTITQQFVKKAMLTDDKSWDRKAREAILSIAIESRFTKEEILQLYLNEIPYGRNAYGIEAASKSYFNKSAKDLTLAESAYLAAMPQAPSRYNPFGPKRELLENRKNTILALMKEQGYITEEQQKAASEEKVVFTSSSVSIKAPHFVFYVQEYLADKYGESTLQEGGLQVYTTLDPRLQEIAERVVKAGGEKNAKRYNAYNAALVAIDPKTGQILSMVGSRDYFATSSEPSGCKVGTNCLFEPNVNVADRLKQPGSSFKPYAYVTAFTPEFKYSPASPLFDVTTNFGTFGGKEYIPKNYNGESNGPLNMRKALAGSLNVPAVKTLDLVGVENAVQTAHDLGITTKLENCGLALVLGGCDVKLIDHVAAYSTLANQGIRHDTTPILKVLDKDGNILEEFKDSPRQVIDPQAVYLLTSIMTDNNARSYVFGANSPLILPGRTVAAKTGTTQDWHDGWTLGFTPSLAAGVWAGNNPGPGVKESFMKKNADGVVVAAPIWHDFMAEALKDTPAEEFQMPKGVQKVVVDDGSGKLPTQYSPSTHEDIFADYSTPNDYDDIHINQGYDPVTGLPITAFTDPSQITYRVCTIYRSERPNNPNWETPVQAFAATQANACPMGTAATVPPPANNGNLTVDILTPEDGASISSLPFNLNVQVIGNNPITRVELSIDGQFYKAVTGLPYTFSVDKQLSGGQHTLAVKATDSQGQTGDTSTSITFTAGQASTSLSITEPITGSTVSFPLNLAAESPSLHNQVQFYYQKDNGPVLSLGAPSNISRPGSNFIYSQTWNTSPGAGTYKIHAQAGNISSPKITIVVP